MNKRLMKAALAVVLPLLVVGLLAACGVFGPVVEERAAGSYGSIQIRNGYLRVGDAVPDNTLGTGDAFFEDAIEVDGELELDGALDADSTANFASTVTFDGGLLNVGGGTPSVAAGANDLYVTGDLEVDGEIEADGTVDFDGTTFDLDATGSIDLTTTEAAADAIHIDANGTVTTGVDVDLGSVSGMSIDGGLVDIGSGTYETADSDNDLGIAGDLEVEGTAYINSLDVDGGTITMENDEVLSNANNGIVTVNGEWGYLQYLVDKSESYTVTTAESGAIFTNDGAGDVITLTLPAASEGLVFGFLAQDDHDIYVDPNASEQILSCTDAGGDICSIDTQYDFTWLVSDGEGWLPLGTVGTLADAN